METKFDLGKIREKALGTDDRQYETLYVDEWDVELPIRTIPSDAIKEIKKFIKTDEVRATALMLYHGCATQDGERVFTRDDVQTLAKEKSFAVVNKIALEIMKISGMAPNAEDEAKND